MNFDETHFQIVSIDNLNMRATFATRTSRVTKGTFPGENGDTEFDSPDASELSYSICTPSRKKQNEQ